MRSRISKNLSEIIASAAIAASLSLGLTFGLLATFPTQVQAQESGDPVSQPGVSILSFDAAEIGPILTEMKILWQARQDPEGRPFILANADGNVIFVLSPLACRGAAFTNCAGAQLISVFEGQANAQTVRDFNNRYAFVNLGINDNGNAYLNRYDIADYGIARGNVATIIQTFVSLANIYNDTVVDAQQTVSIDTPLRHRTANKALARDFVGDDVIVEASAIAKPYIESGDPKIEEASKVLNQIFSDQALPLNRAGN